MKNYCKATNVEKEFYNLKNGLKERGPEPEPLLQATILFHLRGHLMKS
jgi:hypothetical protein